jgi:hypothetical protein
MLLTVAGSVCQMDYTVRGTAAFLAEEVTL